MGKSNSEEVKGTRNIVLKLIKNADVKVSPTSIGDKLLNNSNVSKSLDSETMRVQMYRLGLKHRGSDEDWYMHLKVSGEDNGKDFYGISEQVMYELINYHEVDCCVCLASSKLYTDKVLEDKPYIWWLSKSDIQKLRGNLKVASDGFYKFSIDKLHEVIGQNRGMSVDEFMNFLSDMY